MTTIVLFANLYNMTKGAEQLKAWASRAGLKQFEVAALVRITSPYLSQILHGKRRPSLPIAIRIETATGVPVESWMAIARSKPDRARKHSTDLAVVSGL